MAVLSADAPRAADLRITGAMVWGVVLVGLVLVGEYWAVVLAVGGWWGISGIARLLSVSCVRRLLAEVAEVVLADERAEISSMASGSGQPA
ncbi:hypothetical protein GCM10009764_75680 [Nocardia ninae]|uniref:Uncharacterized protein n=1 Tax=Nocardia ninae NBRC 108245 TaxID=1210091 RepID=A0A511MGJ4_9NOCA|nr:hypothetical protein NN4_43010 [Nocardia ninae NBRC 108245]